MTYWTPQEGPQADAAICPADVIFYGGTRGGGKTDCALGRQIRGSEKYGHKWNGLVVRRKYKDFAEMRRRIDGMIAEGLPAERTGGDIQPNYVRFKNGAQILFMAVMDLSALDSLQGQQFTEITVEECTNFPFLIPMLDKLKGCLRSPYGIDCHLFLTGNPGGPGHVATKTLFIDPAPKNTPFYNQEGESSVFIRSGLEDNKILCENDPKYAQRLRSIKDPALRKAWYEGDWSVFVGQAFNFTEKHVISPIWPVPEYAWIYMTYDWGFGAPFSIAWWWVDADGRIFRFAEWYGWDGIPNQGMRLTDSEIAERIIEHERKLEISNRKIIRLAGHDCFQKKPDYKGGGQGPSTAEVFSRYGVMLTVADSTRPLKIRQFRERLRIPENENEMPMLMVYDTCLHFIRTIPSLCVADNDPEDIDTDQEDHVYDESCHICMARPLAMKEPKPKLSAHSKRIDALMKGDRSNYEDYAIKSQEQAFKDLGLDKYRYGEMGEYEDGELRGTVE